MDKKNSRYYLDLHYPENLIRTICQDDGEITGDRINGLKHSLEDMFEVELDVLERRFRERKSFRQISEDSGRPYEQVLRVYRTTMSKFRGPYRYLQILLGYNASKLEKKKAKEAERKADEEAYAEAVEAIGRPELMDMSVNRLALPVRILNQFRWDGIKTVMDLWIISQRHPKQYERISNIGEKSREEIKAQLRILGFDV